MLQGSGGLEARAHVTDLALARSLPWEHQRKTNIQKKALERKVEGIYTSGFSPLSGMQSLLKMKKYMGASVGFKEDGKVQKWGNGVDKKQAKTYQALPSQLRCVLKSVYNEPVILFTGSLRIELENMNE